MNPVLKNRTLRAIKYAPSLMAISCSIKIFFYEYYNYEPTIINWINLLLNVIITITIYYIGIMLGFCWKHQSLCRIAFWGYYWYAMFMIFNYDYRFTTLLSIYYIILVLVMTLTYKNT